MLVTNVGKIPPLLLSVILEIYCLEILNKYIVRRDWMKSQIKLLQHGTKYLVVTQHLESKVYIFAACRCFSSARLRKVHNL